MAHHSKLSTFDFVGTQGSFVGHGTLSIRGRGFGSGFLAYLIDYARSDIGQPRRLASQTRREYFACHEGWLARVHNIL